MKLEPNSPPIFAPREASVLTISDEDLLSSHAANVLNVSVDSSLRDEEDDYEEFPPTQLSERGDVLTSLEEGHNAYREAAFAAPPSEEGAANNQVFADMPNPFTGAKKPKAVPCNPKAEPGVCYMMMSQFPEIVTLLLSNRCHVMLAEQPTTFGVPSWLEFLGMVNGFVKVVP